MSRASDELREAALESARRAIVARYEARAPHTLAHGPVVHLIAADRVGDAFVVATCAHYRIWVRAQSGSDWCEHAVLVRETRFEPGSPFPSERVLAEDETTISEADADGYDDDLHAIAFARGAVAATRPTSP